VGQDRIALRYQPFALSLARMIPPGQTLTAMITAENDLHRIRILDGRLVHEVWDKSLRELRSGIARSVHARDRTGDRDLARAFRAMVTANANRISYFYLPPSLALAPVLVEPGDRIFIVPSLTEFARRAPQPIQSDFSADFNIYAPGKKTYESVSSEDRVWDERLARMEETTLGRRSIVPGPVTHIYDNRFLSLKTTGAWFYSIGRHGARSADTNAAYESDLLMLVKNASGPGIFYCDTGSGEWAVKFMRYYYDRDTRIPGVERRFIDAQLRLRRAGEGPLNLRLITPGVINDD